MKVGLLVVGNEILEGSTTDTNSGWVARQISGRGSDVATIVTVPDDPERIRGGLDFLASEGPRLIVTLGGLGPTRDDLTVSSVAEHFGTSLHEDVRAVEIVNRRYSELAATGRLTDTASDSALAARAKMALLPMGAIALDNEVGAAPGVWFDVTDELSVVCLPGVPSELKYIFGEQCGPHLQRILGVGYFASTLLVVSTNDESELAHALKQFDQTSASEGVYVKSRARRFGSDVRMHVTVSTKSTSKKELETKLGEALGTFIQILSTDGISVLEQKRDD